MNAGMKNDGYAVLAAEPVVVVLPVFDDTAEPLAVDPNFNDASRGEFD